jgi:site-specific DNA-methyltransferase (adenine-specific)
MELDYKLFLGDSAEVLKKCPDETIDLVVTSPPYDNLRTYNGYTFDFEAIAQQLARVLKPGGVIVWVVNDATVKGSETGSSFKQALYFKSIGLNLHDTMIYGKSSYIPLSHNRYEQQFEFMFVLSKGPPKSVNHLREVSLSAGTTRNRSKAKTKEQGVRGREELTTVSDTKIRGNVWFYNVGKNVKTGHPAVYPIELAQDHIQSWSNPGDIVLDPFLGSGTTGVAALQLNRKFYGIEISEEYFQIAEERISSGTEIYVQEETDTVSQ